jgi:hypothetical protein
VQLGDIRKAQCLWKTDSLRVIPLARRAEHPVHGEVQSYGAHDSDFAYDVETRSRHQSLPCAGYMVGAQMKFRTATARVITAIVVVVCGAARANATLITGNPVSPGPDVVLSSMSFDAGEANLVLTRFGLQLNIVHFGDGSESSTLLTNDSSNLSWLGASGRDFPDFQRFGSTSGSQSPASSLSGGFVPSGSVGSFSLGSSVSLQTNALTATPEPSTMALFVIGSGALMCLWMRRRSAGDKAEA